MIIYKSTCSSSHINKTTLFTPMSLFSHALDLLFVKLLIIFSKCVTLQWVVWSYSKNRVVSVVWHLVWDLSAYNRRDVTTEHKQCDNVLCVRLICSLRLSRRVWLNILLFNFIIYSKCISKRLLSSRLEPTHPSSHPKFTEYDTHTLPTELFRLAFRVQWNATCRWYLVIPLYTYSTRIVKHLFYTYNNTDCFYDERIRYMPLYVGWISEWKHSCLF